MQTYKRVALCVLSLLLSSQLLFPAVSAAGLPLKDKLEAGGSAVEITADETTYATYLEALADQGWHRDASVTIPLSVTAMDGAAALLKTEDGKNVVEQTEEQEQLTWSFAVAEEGFYQLRVQFQALGGNGGDIKRGLLLDGETPYAEWSSFRLTRLYQDNGEPRKTTAGDEVSPTLSEAYLWQDQAVCDVQGLYARPLKVYLTAGPHTLSLVYLQEDIRLTGLTLEPPQSPQSYAQVKEDYAAKGYTEATGEQALFLEAERTATYKTQSTLGMVSDSDPVMSPQQYGYTVMNAIGGSYWNTGNDGITWSFEVKEAGLYRLGMRVFQNYLDGLPVYRQIAIDGTVPFEELLVYEFRDEKSWRSETLCDKNGEAFLFYLEEGPHTLTMTVKLGEDTNGALMKTLEEASATLSDLILTIRMIIGNGPDTLYDYRLDEKIPELMPTLRALKKTLEECTALTLTLNDKRPMLCNQFDQIASRLDKMLEDPYIIPANMSDLTTALSNFGTWIDGLQKQPLLIDFIELLPAEVSVTVNKASFWDALKSGVVTFYRSFTKDYSSVSGLQTDTPITDTLSVWIGRGTTYARELKNLADDDFTTRTGIAVSLHTLPAGQLNSGSVNALMLALSSGAAPDMCLGVAADSPGEFAIRNALADLTQFGDYEEVAAQFEEAMLTPFTYQGGVYALPETLTFQVMLYRTDIFERLGLAVPETWEDVYSRMLPILNQNNLQFYMLCSTVYATYETFLYQHGGTFYNEDYTASALNSPEAYQAMKEYCELFTIWGMPEAADLYNRMRTGEMPVGIGDYTVYLKLLTAAPELSGKWSIAPVPGHVKEDGTVNRTVGSCVSEGCMILEQSDNKEAAWEFLQWWLGTDTQVRYARTIEGIYGATARWPSANLEAFSALSWQKEDLAVIRQSLSNAKAQPVVLGSYYTTRHVNNAWNRVVVSKSQSVRDSLESTVRAIDKELKRRQEQYAIG